MAKIQPSEWIEIGHVAVRTTSVLTAMRVASKVKRTRQKGKRDGVEFMCLARFREAIVG